MRINWDNSFSTTLSYLNDNKLELRFEGEWSARPKSPFKSIAMGARGPQICYKVRATLGDWLNMIDCVGFAIANPTSTSPKCKLLLQL